MEEALRFFRTYEMWMYVILALVGLVYVRKFILAWEELRRAAFGLERESAQSSLNQSAGMLVLLFLMAVAVFILVSFVAPNFPASNPLLTPTMDLLASPTTTLVPEGTEQGIPTPTEGEVSLTPTIEVVGEGCVPGQIMLTEPVDGSEINGVVIVKGTANIENFGFYKYEFSTVGTDTWTTISAGTTPVKEGELGQWDTTARPNGDYFLQLVIIDNVGQTLEPCIIAVRIANQ